MLAWQAGFALSMSFLLTSPVLLDVKAHLVWGSVLNGFHVTLSALLLNNLTFLRCAERIKKRWEFKTILDSMGFAQGQEKKSAFQPIHSKT